MKMPEEDALLGEFALVVDTNVVIAALLRPGKTRDLFFSSNVQLFSPIHLLEELSAHQEELRAKTGLDRPTYLHSVEDMISNIIILQPISLLPNEPHARRICPDHKDWPFFAAAFYLNCPLWSNDKRLKKQNEITVYDTASMSKKIEDAPWRDYGMRRMAEGEDARELFKF